MFPKRIFLISPLRARSGAWSCREVHCTSARNLRLPEEGNPFARPHFETEITDEQTLPHGSGAAHVQHWRLRCRTWSSVKGCCVLLRSARSLLRGSFGLLRLICQSRKGVSGRKIGHPFSWPSCVSYPSRQTRSVRFPPKADITTRGPLIAPARRPPLRQDI